MSEISTTAPKNLQLRDIYDAAKRLEISDLLEPLDSIFQYMSQTPVINVGEEQD